ncbi:chemotaxis protein CheW [Aquabacter sp. CN5-332]|uniref:chemotaxis protein CheW n=1 Tax=Aquabacter sp. CN5-332 TaxID=3156608 RepID=UPI0032B4CE50
MKPFHDHALEVVTLSLDDNVFALEACHVREILDLVPVTEVPTSNPFVGGLINVRGKVVPLADLRHKFGMALRPPTVDTRIIVIEIDLDGDRTTIGLLADKVYEVTQMAPAALEETPKIGMAWRQEFIRCIAKREGAFVVVLDIAAVFASGRQGTSDFGGDPTGRHAA